MLGKDIAGRKAECLRADRGAVHRQDQVDRKGAQEGTLAGHIGPRYHQDTGRP